MKKIEWQQCVTKSVVGRYPPENGKILNPGDDVNVGMKVSARYNDLTVMLEINKEIENQIFSATVLSFEPVLAEKPADLTEGDVVKIQKENVCCLFA